MQERNNSDRWPPLKGVRRKPVRSRLPGIVIFQVENTLSSSLAAEFRRRGVSLAQLSVPLSKCSDRDYIEKNLEEALERIGQIELVLAFADHLGPEGEISKSQSRASLSEAISANIVSLKLFFDAIFKAAKQVRQVCVLTFSGEAMASSHPGFEVAIAGLEVMVKLYAAEQESTHFSMVALHKPWQQRAGEEHLAETITTALSKPSGVLLDEHGRQWQIVHKIGKKALQWKLGT